MPSFLYHKGVFLSPSIEPICMDWAKSFCGVTSDLYLLSLFLKETHARFAVQERLSCLSQHGLYQTVLCSNMPKINHSESDSKSLTQHPLLSHADLDYPLASLSWSLCSQVRPQRPLDTTRASHQQTPQTKMVATVRR